MFQARQQVGLYTLIRKLGEGGFGEVWLAENSRYEKVAVKLPHKGHIDLQAVKDEIFNWILSGKHKNILPIIECETFGNQIAIVSEYAPDGSLQNLVNRKGSLPVLDAVEITIGILDGLTHLHNRKIIHRDLKPDNVLFQGKTPRLTDFGISSAMAISSQSQTVSGTLSYMAPEAFDGKRNAQTDIWAVGVILYQLLTGNLPFPQKGMIELVGALARQEPAPLPTLIPPNLQTIVKTALEKDSAKRYKNPDEMAKALREFLRQNADETLKLSLLKETLIIPSPEVLPTDNSPTIIEPVANKSDSVVTKVKVPSETNERETTIRPISSQAKPKTNPLLFLIPSVILLFFAILGGSYLLSGKSEDTNVNSSANSLPPKFTNATLIPFRKGDKWGFSDDKKNIIIEPTYDEVSRFSDGLALVKSSNQYGFIDKSNREVIPLKNGLAEPFKDGLAKIHMYGKQGFIDKTGKEIIPPKYDEATDFAGGMAWVGLNKKYGFINQQGEEVIPLQYDYLYNNAFSEGLATILLNGKFGFIDKTGKEIVPPRYDWAESFSEGLAQVTLNNKVGFIDKTGKEVIALKYGDINDNYQYGNTDKFSEGLAPVTLDGKWGFIDETGKEVIPIKYENVSQFSEGLAAVQLNDKWGFIDKTGTIVIPFKYHVHAESGDIYLLCSDGIIAVEQDYKDFYIDKNGNEVFPIKYDSVNKFSDGLGLIKLNGKEFYIDKNGTEYYEP